MSKDLKQLFELLKQSTIFWTFALFSFAIFRYYGIVDELNLEVNENLMHQNFKIPLLIAPVGGFFFGINFWYC